MFWHYKSSENMKKPWNCWHSLCRNILCVCCGKVCSARCGRFTFWLGFIVFINANKYWSWALENSVEIDDYLFARFGLLLFKLLTTEEWKKTKPDEKVARKKMEMCLMKRNQIEVFRRNRHYANAQHRIPLIDRRNKYFCRFVCTTR